MLTTINRNPVSFLGAIVAAEYVLGLLPTGTSAHQLPDPRESHVHLIMCYRAGTHDWHKFLTPSEITAKLLQRSMMTERTEGFGFNPLTQDWFMAGPNTLINYGLVARKPSAQADHEGATE